MTFNEWSGKEWLENYIATHGEHCIVDAPHYFALDVWNAATEAAQPRWISVGEMLPEPGKKVLAGYKNSHGVTRRICAMYVPDKWLNTDDQDFDEGAVYDEETDNYYWPSGWYERIENWDDYSSVAVHDVVTHWLELPELPE